MSHFKLGIHTSLELTGISLPFRRTGVMDILVPTASSPSPSKLATRLPKLLSWMRYASILNITTVILTSCFSPFSLFFYCHWSPRHSPQEERCSQKHSPSQIMGKGQPGSYRCCLVESHCKRISYWLGLHICTLSERSPV